MWLFVFAESEAMIVDWEHNIVDNLKKICDIVQHYIYFLATLKNQMGINDPIFLVVLPAIQTTHLLGSNNPTM